MVSAIRILFIGDIVGHPGRRIVKETLPGLVAEHAVDLVLANGENAAAGVGITPALVEELLGTGIAVLTSGNHIFDKREIIPYLAEHPEGRLLRPANYPPTAPGRGVYIGKTGLGVDYAVLNVQGRVFMPTLDCPFRTVDALLASIPPEVKVRILDLHGEATSEKIAMGWYLDGRVTAIVGTHTHVPTADETVLPGGTAYITDLGMTGPYDSVIGMDKEAVLRKFLTLMPARYEVGKNDVRLAAVLIEVDSETGRASSIQRVRRKQP
jgi:2',3'-cyclic-nucleotide 2'-phosphodiesterase